MTGLVVDLFAGGGGASAGIEAALGRQVDIAINHSPTALNVHRANHPRTVHLTADIWDVKPLTATKGRPVDLLWASPDCTHFSQAKGGKPRSQKIRSLAWAVTRWAAAVRPTIIFVENVSEFKGWGPLDEKGKPIKARMGETFRRWERKLKKLGYVVDYKILDSSQYGAPTKRRRLFLVARCDGEPINWPKPTHGKGLLPFRTAAECIDWSLPCPSIFERKKPLVEKTMRRIAAGLQRFVIDNPKPFVVQCAHGESSSVRRPESIDEPLSTVTGARRTHALVSPTLVRHFGQSNAADVAGPMPTVMPGGGGKVALVSSTLITAGYGEREGQALRVPGIDKPLGTVVAQGKKHALVSAFLAKHFGDTGQRPGVPMDEPVATITASDHHSLVAASLLKFRGTSKVGAQLELPMPTITGQGNHLAEVRAFLTTYYSSGKVGQRADEPMRTITGKDRIGLVTIEGTDYQIVDIGMRMLQPHELLRAQFGRFAADYDMSAATTKEAKVRLIGNSVCPEVAEALVRVNVTFERLKVAA